ncbi:efflux RND transporter periplasmic adaptor subunit [Arcobacter sp. CECT 8985]|uniref:efflux RND transporter periplasmic adaptor subunit n=1 Tax=Arcobacter sp. CECT 8985 TaxID=1935424 RepID=UPI00100B2268|nr:efflux RND transporter periplasmic adaptor subunit [Arcobacter sp. CECT 8985]RXJ88047.1 efflux transporter periplasmic adaptor subunit [Arcobacter sp. CECT 8985]
MIRFSNKKIVALAVVAALAFSACSDDSSKKQAQKTQQERPALPVKAYTTKSETPVITKEYPGLIKAVEDVNVIARVSGTLENKYFKEGEFVKKGKLLYKIEQDVYKSNLDMAKANVRKAKANYDKTLKDYHRAQKLFKNKAISQQSYDDYVFSYQDALAQYESNKASLQKAQIEYDYTTVEAPISGIVGIKKRDIGDYVGTTQDNSLLVTITSINPIHVEFSLRKDDIEDVLPQIKKGKTTITLDAMGKTYTGKIDYISPKLDVNTDTLLLRAKFKNDTNDLIVGQFTKVKINNIKMKNVFIIPESAVMKTVDGDFVYVIKNSKAKIRPVKVGQLLDRGLVITDGLKSDEKVIISNIAKTKPDTKVQVIGK